MKVLFAKKEDAEDILALQKEAYISEAELHNDFDIPPLTQTLAELTADFAHKTILKIESDGKLLASGQAQLKGNTCHIGRMAVRPAFHGQGLGSKMLSALEKLFPECKRIELFTGQNSTRNLAMYKSRGYEPFKTAKLGNTTVIYLQRLVGKE